MVLIRLGSRYEIRTHLNAIFEANEDEDYVRAARELRRLRFCLRKYYVTRGQTIQKFEALFEDAFFQIRNPNRFYKKILVEEAIDQIIIGLQEQLPDPNDRLREIFYELRFLFARKWDDKTVTSIIDCGDEIMVMKHDFAKNIYFSAISQQITEFLSILITVSKIKNPPAMYIDQVIKKFTSVSNAVQLVLTSESPSMSEEELRRMITGANGSVNETQT